MAQTPDEKTYVEIPFIEQLKAMGWDHIEGDIDVPYLTERESFRDVLLTGRLRKAIKKINLDDEGKPWLDDDRINEMVSRLERISAPKLLEANKEAFDLIVQGIEVAGDPERHDGREKGVAVIDFEHPERNQSVYRRRDSLQGKTGPEGCQNQAVEESERYGWIIEGKCSLLEIEKAGSGSPFSE